MLSVWLTYLKQGLSKKLPEDRISGKIGYGNIWAGLYNLQSFVRPHLSKFLAGFSLILLYSLFSFPQPLITRYIIDDVILGRKLGLLAGAILLLVGINLTARLLQILERFYFIRFQQAVMLDIQEDLIDRTFRLPQAFFDDNQTGYLMSRLNSDVEELNWFFSGTIIHILGNILRFFGGILFLFYLEWRLALAVTAVIPVLFLCIYFFSVKMHTLSHQEMEQQAHITSRLQEYLSAASLVKAFSSERRATGRLISALKAAFQVALEQVAISSVADLAITLVPAIVRMTVLALGAYWIIKGQWSLGSLLAFQAYLEYVFGPARYLAAANLDLQKALAALQRVSALFEIVPEERGDAAAKVARLKGAVAFRNVSFSYDKHNKVLEDISFRVEPGEKIALVGPSGVGKTTLISLILRFYKPTEGEICFDGKPAGSYELSSLRERIGYVSQQALLLSGTVMENLCYGNPTASEEDVIRSAKATDCYEFIMNLPEGFKTEIGERGIRLSEGQKQRLSLARALVKDPDVLVLDEPSAALDSLTEKSIFSAIRKLVEDKTLFIAAHRLSTIQESDRIFLLKENRLAAVGTHQSLLAENEFYRSIVEYQQGGEG